MTQSLHLPAPTPGPPNSRPACLSSLGELVSTTEQPYKTLCFFFSFPFFPKRKGLRSRIPWLAVLQADSGPEGPPPAHQPGRRVSPRESTVAPSSWPRCCPSGWDQPGAVRRRGIPRRRGRGTAHRELRAALDRTRMEAGGRRVTAVKTAGARWEVTSLLSTYNARPYVRCLAPSPESSKVRRIVSI